MTGAKSWLHVDEVESEPGVHLLRISGELDLGTIGGLQSGVEQRVTPGARVVLDLEGLRFCDSTGLGAIIKLHRRLADLGGVLALAAPGQRVLDVLGISGVDQVIGVYPSTAAATRAVRLPAPPA
ncbi:MAG TPA: STAS domain-containing protein [Rugosimonospora sp.]|nr:STAS domain-containing protein [Rugosimonospora sp.]